MILKKNIILIWLELFFNLIMISSYVYRTKMNILALLIEDINKLQVKLKWIILLILIAKCF
jgi:hypothetical protein